VWVGWQLFYKNRWRVDILKGPFAWSYQFVANKYFLDDIYLKGIVRPVQYTLARAAYWFDQHIIDGIVNGTAAGTLASSKATYGVIDQQIVDFAVNGAAGLTGMSGGLLRYVQTGNIQRYAAVLFASIALFVAVLAFS
jgi:NADH-quinone oxidoreductase subunit L